MYKLRLPLVISFILFSYFFIFNLLQLRFIHDTSEIFNTFKYFHNFYSLYNYFPSLIHQIDYTVNSFGYIAILGNLGIILIKIFSKLNINSYYIYQLYISILLYLIIYGFYKNIKNQNYITEKIILFSFLLISSSVYFSQLGSDLIFLVPSTYIFYYSNKFAKKK